MSFPRRTRSSARMSASFEASRSGGEDEWEYYDENAVLSTFWQAMVDGGNVDNPVNLWLNAFIRPKEDGDEEFDVIYDYWRVAVPLLLSPSARLNSLEQKWKEEEIKRKLFDVMERFISGGEDPEEYFSKLAGSDVQPAVCGHLFVPGETCYSCKDCACDSTCVMCSTCFQNSEHRNHGYRMYCGSGGGMCDCGDPEAFKNDATCSLHKLNEKGTNNLEDYDYPRDMIGRVSYLFKQVLLYVIEMTTKKQKFRFIHVGQIYKETFRELNHSLDYAKYCLMVMNDNNHTYAEVTRVLDMVCKMQTSVSNALTEYINVHGRAFVYVGSFSECATLRDNIGRVSRRDGSSLKCEVYPSYVVAHQTFADRLLQWMVGMFNKCAIFRKILVDVMQSSSKDVWIECNKLERTPRVPIADMCLLYDTIFWKDMRRSWYTLIRESILKDVEAKKMLSWAYVKYYSIIMDDYCADDQESDATITDLGLQIFTVPSVAQDLIENHDCFFKIANYFNKQIEDQSVEADGEEWIDTWMGDMNSDMFSRVKQPLDDLRYLLTKAPESSAWNDKLRRSFIKGGKEFLKILFRIQGVDRHHRESQGHIEFENISWENVLKFLMPLQEIVTNFLEWLKMDKTVLSEILRFTLECIRNDPHREKHYSRNQEITYIVNDWSNTYTVMEFDLFQEEISVNTPMERMAGFLITLFHGHGSIMTRSAKNRITGLLSLAEIVRPVEVTVSMVAQIESGLWKRNGTAMNAVSGIYNVWLPSQKLGDLHILQAALSMSDDPSVIIASIIERFGLTQWAQGGLATTVEVNDMANELLLFFIALLCERFSSGVGEIDTEGSLRYQMVQMLSTGPRSFSDIVKNHTRGEEIEIEEPLKQVGNLTQSKKDPNRKVFELKPQYRDLINPYYYFFTKEQGSAASTHQKELAKKEKKEWYPKPPKFPRLSEPFSGLTKVMSSLPMIVLINSLLKKIRQLEGTAEVEDGQVIQQFQKLFFLIIVGCEDDLHNNSKPTFIKLAHKYQFLEKISGLKLPKELSVIADYTLKKIDEARRVKLNISEEIPESETYQGESTGDFASAQKRRREAVANHRAKVMAQMSKMQKQFANKNASELEGIADVSRTSFQDDTSKEELLLSKKPVAVGQGRDQPVWENERHTCMLCMEEQPVWIEGKDVLVMACYIHKSTVLSKGSVNNACEELYLTPTLSCGPFITSCGHVMHSRCYQQFLRLFSCQRKVQVGRQASSVNLFREVMNYNINWQEFICPTCQRICNNVLPLYPSLSSLRCLSLPSSSNLSTWVQKTKLILSKHCRIEESQLPWVSLSNEAVKEMMKVSLDRKDILRIHHRAPELPQEQKQMSTTFALNALKKCLLLYPFEEDGRVLHILLQTITMTLHQQQIRNTESISINELLPREYQSLQSLVRLTVLLPFAECKDPSKLYQSQLCQCLQSNALYLLSIIFNDDQNKTFLDVDPLTAMVFLIVGYPLIVGPDSDGAYPVGKFDQFIIQLGLVITLLHLLANDEVDLSMGQGRPTLEDKAVQDVARELACTTQRKIEMPTANGLKLKLLHFLRCASLFQHFLTDVPLPTPSIPNDVTTVYEDLCTYLGLPTTLNTLLANAEISKIIKKLLTTEKLKASTGCSYPPVKRPLINLPESYVDVLKIGDKFICPNSDSGGESKHPAICLICGVTLCSMSSCCSVKLESETVGSCVAHAITCSGGVGMFLLARRCEVAFLADKKKGAFFPAPYTDEYGESDQQLKRGNPLKLNHSMMEDLVNIWKFNEIPERISRKFDPEFRTLHASWHIM